MTEKRTCFLGRLCRGIKYSEIGHHKGASIFWFNKNELRTYVSQGTFKDFHCHVIREVEKQECDLFWRGRATQEMNGVVSLLPPTMEYVKDKFGIPEKMITAIKKKFHPSIIVVQAKDGMRVLEE